MRRIHKASVRDRLVHHAFYRQMYPLFAKVFIADSYSCQLEKGTHKAVARFKFFARQSSRNNTATCWVLKCDIKKSPTPESLASYLGLLKHGDTFGLRQKVLNDYWLWEK